MLITPRKILFWFHLIAGVSAGAVILIMSITGVLLTYEKQITSWVDRELRAEPLPAGATSRLPLRTLLSTAGDAGMGTPTSVTFHADSAAAAFSTSSATVYVNAYDGRVIGTGSTAARAFFRRVTEWHRYIALSGDRRPTGKAVTGAANFIFLFIVVSGGYLWWRGAVSWFRTGLRGKALYWNWHNVFGVWTSIPLFLIVLSGTVISYPWASDLVYRLAGSEAPRRSGGGQRNADAALPSAAELATADFAIAHTGLQIPDWKTIAIRMQAARDAALSLTVDRGNGGQPQLRSTLTVDRKGGKEIRVENFADQDLGRRTRSWLRFVHTGEYYGIAGQTVAGIASFAAVMLVWTGFALSLGRFLSWKKQDAGLRGNPSDLRTGR